MKKKNASTKKQFLLLRTPNTFLNLILENIVYFFRVGVNVGANYNIITLFFSACTRIICLLFLFLLFSRKRRRKVLMDVGENYLDRGFPNMSTISQLTFENKQHDKYNLYTCMSESKRLFPFCIYIVNSPV